MPIPLPRPVNWPGLATIATTGLTLFCVAWFFSSFVASPALAVCAGVIFPVLVASGIGIANGLLLLAGLRAHPLDFLTIHVWYCGICLVLASVGFGVGTWHYLRRVEP